MNDTLVYYGEAVKALGDGRIGGYLIRFGGRDLEGEYFTAKTYLGAGDGDGRDVLFHHGIPMRTYVDGKEIVFTELADTNLSPMRTRREDIGIWAEVVMNMADEYEKRIYELAEAGKLGWSSGAAGHTVRKADDGEIKRWIIAEGSLTPTPAEPRNRAVLLKSLFPADPTPDPEPEAQRADEATASPGAADGDGDGDAVTQPTYVEVRTMPEDTNTQVDKDNTQAAPDAPAAALKALEERVSARIDALMKHLDDDPRLARGGVVTQAGGTADVSIKNAADMFKAIARRDDKRATKHYGLVKAQTEGDGAAGGYYVPDQILADMLPNLNLNSSLGNLVTRIAVQLPAGEMPIRDFSRTPTADAGHTAEAQGLESQARSEGGAYTEETIYFEMLTYRVTDAASGYLSASRELSEDYAAVEGLIRSAIQTDVASKEEYFILRGNGTNQPLGVLNWGGIIGVNEDTDNTFVVADADEMLSRLMVGDGSRVVWVHHPSIITSVAAFERGTGGAVYQSNIAGALATSLHGYPRLASQHLPQIGTNGYCVLGDWSRYFIFDRGGLYIDFSEHADFLNGKNVWRFGKRIDGKPAMTSAVTLADGSFTVSPFVRINNLS